MAQIEKIMFPDRKATADTPLHHTGNLSGAQKEPRVQENHPGCFSYCVTLGDNLMFVAGPGTRA